MQQTKQQELQGKKAVIDAKYASYKGNKQMEARKRQEMADLYKKEGVSPLGGVRHNVYHHAHLSINLTCYWWCSAPEINGLVGN